MKWKLITVRKLKLWPYTMIYPGLRDELKELIGVGYNNILDVYKDGTTHSHIWEEDGKKVSEILLKRAIDDASFFKNLKKICDERCKKLTSAAEKINKINLSSISNLELANLYNEFCGAYKEIGPFLDIPILFDEIGGAELKKWLSGKTKKVEEYATALAAPEKPSYVMQDLTDFIELSLKNLETKNDDWIKGHLEEYCWVPYNQGETTWDLKHYAELFGEIKNNVNKYKNELNRMKALPNEIRKEREKIIAEIKPPKQIQNLINSLIIAVEIKDDRRAAFNKSDYLTEKMFDELARRINLSRDEVKFTLPLEIIEFLRDKKKIEKDLPKRRIKYSIYLMKNGGVHVSVGEVAKGIEDLELEKTKIDKTVVELAGNKASPGKANGPARIVKYPDEVGKVKEGDILVAIATNPSYVTAFGKVKAVITNEGGLTCHAAILSREMKIPCITGVKDATEILEDGEEIIVDANNGKVVRCVKKK